MTTRSLAVLAAFSLSPVAVAQPLQSVRIASGLNQPLFTSAAPGAPGTLYVVQRNGTVRTLDTATNTLGATPFLTLPSVPGVDLVTTGSEQGLLGMAFHPDYQTNGFFYLNYTTTAGTARVERYTASGGTVVEGSRQTVIEVPHPGQTNHNGGWLGFNPANGTTGGSSGHLYIATGDGGGANDPGNNAQNTGNLLGKVLRVDVNNPAGGNNYGIPAGNLTGTGVRGEIYAYGLRNPYRNSFDRATGDLYIADVGQSAREEIDFIANGAAGGANFGWRRREGTIQTPGSVGGPLLPGDVDPIHEYTRDLGQSVTGGYVYRGPNAELDGTYFYADFVTGRIWSLRYDGTTVTDVVERTGELQNANGGGTLNSIASFGEDGFGNLYVLDYGGEVYRIVPVPEPTGVAAVVGMVAIAWRAKRRRN